MDTNDFNPLIPSVLWKDIDKKREKQIRGLLKEPSDLVLLYLLAKKIQIYLNRKYTPVAVEMDWRGILFEQLQYKKTQAKMG